MEGVARDPGPWIERKQATVLFADIVGSTSLIEALDAEEALERFRPVLSAMAQAVRQFDGTIIRTLGDGLKASFGAPLAKEGHALLACQAALAMREAVAALPSPPSIRIGIHSGEVVAGEFDTGAAVERETVGMTVHVASRIEQFAESGTIYLSRESHQLVSAYCDTIPIGHFSAKGLSEPVELHELVGLRPAISSSQFRGASLVRMYGRHAQLAQLHRSFVAAEHGEGGVVGIVAPAGLGKSRLCYEFGEWCRRQGTAVLEGRVLVSAHAGPLQIVLEMLRSFLRISPFDDPGGAGAAVGRKLQDLGLTSEADRILLTEFLGIGAPEPALASMDPRAKHGHLRDLVRRIVQAGGDEPGLIVVEDLHWLDRPSGDFIETLVDAVAGTRTLLLLNFRPGFAAGWMERSHYVQISLSELDAADTRDLVRELIGDAPSLAGLRAQIAERCSGNPFFAQELVRSLSDRGVLIGSPGRYEEGQSADLTRLPATIEAVLGARIDSLPEHGKLVLQVGAIIGRDFPVSVLTRAVRMPEAELAAALLHLCDSTLVQKQDTVAGPGFTFRHPLIQEVAYSMQLRSRRSALHKEVASAIEQLEWGRLDETASLLAYHYEAADDQMNAALHLQRAARWIGRSSSAEAFRAWNKVRLLLQDLPHSPANDRMCAVASGQILSFGWREGMLADEAKPFADEALRYARSAGDNMHSPLILGAYGRILAATGAADAYIDVVREALALTEASADARRATAVSGMLVQAYYFAGLLREALAANDAALARISEQRDMDQHVAMGLTANQLLGFDIENWIECYRTLILVRLGRFAEADTWLAKVTRNNADQVDYVVQFIPHMARVELAWWNQDPVKAGEHAAVVVDYAAKAKTPYMQAHGAVAIALARSTDGDFSGAAQILRNGIDLARKAQAGREMEPRMLAELADAQLADGDVDAAAITVREAMEVARRRTHRIWEAHACMTGARTIVRNQGRAGEEEMQALLRRARELIEITGTCLLDRLLATTEAEVKAA